jgi:hypothetical protein
MDADTHSPSAQTHTNPADPKANEHSQKLIHRVCTQCNNMFSVTPDHYDAKQCPVCHKG